MFSRKKNENFRHIFRGYHLGMSGTEWGEVELGKIFSGIANRRNPDTFNFLWTNNKKFWWRVSSAALLYAARNTRTFFSRGILFVVEGIKKSFQNLFFTEKEESRTLKEIARYKPLSWRTVTDIFHLQGELQPIVSGNTFYEKTIKLHLSIDILKGTHYYTYKLDTCTCDAWLLCRSSLSPCQCEFSYTIIQKKI